MGAAIAALVAWLGQRINRNYNEVQSEKLRQDRELEHKKHNLELYKSLGSDNPRGQFAAAAVLLQRLEHLSRDPRQENGKAKQQKEQEQSKQRKIRSSK